MRCRVLLAAGWLALLAVTAQAAVELRGTGGEVYRLDGTAHTTAAGAARFEAGTGHITQPTGLEAGLVAVKDGRPWLYSDAEVVHIAAGHTANRRANCLYSTTTFRGLLFLTDDGSSPDLRVDGDGFRYDLTAPATIKAVDLWPIFGWRPENGWPGEEVAGLPKGHVVPRAWVEQRRPFPWPTFSPVQLPFLSLSSDEHFPQVKEQLDFLARELRDYGFFCFGEWPLTQRYPEYDPKVQAQWIAGNQRACDYAHELGLKILRWVTDPDLQPDWYPELHHEMQAKGWFAALSDPPTEWLLDYTNPDVQHWLRDTYAAVGRMGADFYWVDNNHPTTPVKQPDLPPPVAFRGFYESIRQGLLATGRNDILIRSGASSWADFTGVGILDVYAPGPDVQDDWTEQQWYVVDELARRDYLCHYHLWRRAIDDYFPAGPQTIDQTRAMASLLAVTGLGFTTTDVGLPNLPHDRLEMLRQLLPIVTTRPMSLSRFNGPRPRAWVLNVGRGDQSWQVAGVFNWDLRREETLYLDWDDLGLEPGTRALVYDFYSQAPVGIFDGAVALRLAPTSGRALAIHPLQDRPLFVSTDRHITQGAAEIEGLQWDAAARVLSGRFNWGVEGRTWHVTVYVPDRFHATEARVGGGEVPLESVGYGLVRFAVTGRTALWQVGFVPRTLDLPQPGPGSLRVAEGTAVVDLRRRQRPSADFIAALRQDVVGGQRRVVIAPRRLTPEVLDLQRALGVRWGLFRTAPGERCWLLADAYQPDEPDDELVFRTSCVGCRPNAVDALWSVCGKGAVAVLGPDAEPALLEQVVKALGSDAWLAAAHATERSFRHDTAVRLTDVAADAAAGHLTARLDLPQTLRGRRLSVHLRREWGSLEGQRYAGVPQLGVAINGTPLPVMQNPCRPYSPPQGYDELYHAIPDGVLRWDGSDRIELQAGPKVARPELFAGEAASSIELRIEDASRVGDTGLVPLPEPALVGDERPFEALLGAGGAVVSVTHGTPGVAATVTGEVHPHSGWPVRRHGESYCVWALDEMTLEVTVPKGSAGTIEVLAYDADAYRHETLLFEDGTERPLTDFADGIWVAFPFTAQDSADGRLRLTVRKDHGYNCVLSRLRVRLNR